MMMLPEFIILGTAFLILFLDLVFIHSLRAKQSFLPLALVGTTLALVATLILLNVTGEMLGGRFQIDPVTMWFKVIFLSAGFLIISISQTIFENVAEFLSVLLFTLTGMMFLASSRDLVTLYVSLETATIPLFLLTAWLGTTRSGEAGIKYTIIGAAASAFILYGFGLLYGLTEETSLNAIASTLFSTDPSIFIGTSGAGNTASTSGAAYLAAGLITAGVGFKLTLFPFHMWAPDVYEGAPTPVTAYLSTASKAVGLALAFHVFYRIFGLPATPLAPQVPPYWSAVIALIAALTMTLGNVAALLQTNVKRLMAYSAISQAGYIFLGFLDTSVQSVTAMLFYMLIYVFTNLAAFAVIMVNEQMTGREDLASFRGLSKTNPALAFAFLIALFGLAGIPPLSGFMGKFFLFSVAAKQGYYWLVAVAAINSTISLYYYLRLVREMYIEKATPEQTPIVLSPALGLGLAIAIAGSVVFGIVPFFYEKISEDATRWITGMN